MTEVPGCVHHVFALAILMQEEAALICKHMSVYSARLVQQDFMLEKAASAGWMQLV